MTSIICFKFLNETKLEVKENAKLVLVDYLSQMCQIDFGYYFKIHATTQVPITAANGKLNQQLPRGPIFNSSAANSRRLAEFDGLRLI